MSEYDIKSIGKRIKKLRKEHHETQSQLGKEISLCQNSVSKIECGKTELTFENLMNIAKHYNVSLDYICMGKNEKTVLSFLENYISIIFRNVSQGEVSFNTPILSIKKSLLKYLMHTAKIRELKEMPDDIKNMWLKREETAFYDTFKQKSTNEVTEVVPAPIELLCPDSEREKWKQSDLLREINNKLNKLWE